MSNAVTFCSNQVGDSRRTSPRAAVFVPAITNATVENHQLQSISEESAKSYYVCSEVLLSTALVLVHDEAGKFVQCRVILDSGSQLSLVAQNCANRLRLPSRRSHKHVSGVARKNLHTLHQPSSVRLKSFVEPSFVCILEKFIVPEVTGPIPAKNFERGNWPHVTTLRMADPDYNISTTIDLLLGADCLPVIIRSGLKQGWGMGMGIRMGMGIILQKFGIRMGMGIEKTIDREWEWEFGTLIRAGIGMGIGKNIHTIPLTF